MSRTFYCGFTGPIDPNTAQRIAAAFNQAIIDGYSEIYFCFSSSGGFIADGIYLYNHILGLPIKTTIHNTGTVASIATAVYVAADVRVCSKQSMFLIHPITVPSEPHMAAEALQARLTSAIADDKRTDNILRDRATGITEEVLTRRLFTEVLITPEDALKFGIVHRVDEFMLPTGVNIFQI